VSSQTKDLYKIADGAMYKLVEINQVDHWLPYLILEPGKCIVIPEIDHFGTVSISNCTLEIENGEIVFQRKKTRVNGNVESEELVTLNRYYIPTEVREISVFLKDYTSIFSESNVHPYILTVDERCVQ
jgi:hypothetical protein